MCIRDSIRHVVHAGGFACQEFGSLDGPFAEYSFGVGGMGEGYDFVFSGEDDIMVADDGAASDGTDADRCV